VLQIGIHDRDELSLARQRALEESAGETATADAPDAANARVALTELLGDGGGGIGRVVIDENELPGEPHQGQRDALYEHAYVGRFIEGGKNDGQHGGQARR